MYRAKRPTKWPVIIILLLASWLLVACGTRISNDNWPGLSANGDTVYVAYGDGILAYDVVEEEEKWLFAPQPRSLLFFAPPSVANDRVIFGDFGASGGFFSPGVVSTVYGMEQQGDSTLDELWANSDLTTDRIVASALQVADRVYLGTSDNKVLALDAVDGELIWEFETEHSVWSQPAYKDGILYVTSLDRNVYALDADDGTELWRTPLDGAISSKPVVDSTLLYVTSFDRKLHALDLNSGEEAWSVEAQDWIWGSAVLADGVVYFADAQGNVYAVDAETGDGLWTQQVDGAVQTSPVVVDGIVYIASDQLEGDEPTGLLTALTADAGEQLWQQSTPVPLYTTPVVVNGMIIVAVQTETDLLIAFDAQTGVQQWDVSPPDLS